MSGRPERCEALVLRHMDYADSDRIVSFLSADHGVQRGFARSARNSRKRFGAALEPFSQVIVHWRSGRGQLWNLQEVELLDARTGLRRDLMRLALAGYAAELVELLVEESQPHARVFELVCAYLDYLSADGDLQNARLLLELRLIYLLGYMPHLLHCSECLKIFSAEPVRFDAVRGGSLCQHCAAGGGFAVGLGTIGSLARTLRVSHQTFSGFNFGQQTLEEGSRLLSQVLHEILPRPPKSLKFLQATG